MRILHLTYFLKWGGLERQLFYLTNALAREGHDVHVGYFEEGHKGGREEMQLVHLHRIEKTNHYDPLIVWRLIRMIRTIKPDVVQTWHYLMDVFGGFASQFAGIPWVIREPLPNAAGGTWKAYVRVRAARRATWIISNCLKGEEYWRSHCPRVPHTIIPNGLPLEAIENVKPARECSSAMATFLYVGQLLPRKRVDSFVQALSILNATTCANAVICGCGPQKDDIIRFVHKNKLEDRVQLLGLVSKETVWSLMKSASAFVFLSENEGCPNAVLEAMACKCPLIVSDIPAHREILDDSSALFVHPQDTKQLVTTMQNIIRDDSAAKQCAFEANQRVKRRSIRCMLNRYVEIYDRIRFHRNTNEF